MNDPSLADAVHTLAERATGLNEVDLAQPWKWNSYDEEGKRFVFFRSMEELRSLAVQLAQVRLSEGQPITQAQRILAQYHAAFRDLQASVLGLDVAGFNQAPSEGEWPVRQTLAHILGADLGFYVLVHYALDRHRSSDGRPERFDDAAFRNYLNLTDERYEQLMDSPAKTLLTFHEDFHRRVLTDLGQIRDSELELDSFFWEDEPYPLRFRLHRFESHLRQHTVQIDKTLAQIGRLPGEALRLTRLVYAAWAEAEGAMLGSKAEVDGLVIETARRITAWVQEIS